MSKPDVLVFAKSPSTAVMSQLEQQFECHHVWQQAAAHQNSMIDAVGACIRAVWTVGPIGLDGGLIARLPRLEVVVVNSVGLDKIDLPALAARGIKVTNTPGVLTDDVADLAVLLLLAAQRRLPAMDAYVRRGDWAAGERLQPAHGLRGKTAGIFGFGRIGQAVAARLAPFGMEIAYYQPRAIDGIATPRAQSLLELAARSDYLILSAPATSATRHAVNAEVLSALGPQGVLVNIARGALVDEAALVAALSAGRLGAAALDVFDDEPDVPAPLCALPNTVLTPHIGSLTVETRHAMGQLTLDNLVAYFAGLPLITPV
ncbi:MAG: 2-hydroxyacid dehydrogenase [Massilia sp.]|jgi:lactate dehydrogenase-like 2-hydroxyacid dehydrogenase|nr:2-hydroxyacid dehydrogenase [Massilia sp.]